MQKKTANYHARAILEELETRQLFSAGVEGLAVPTLAPENLAIHLEVGANTPQTSPANPVPNLASAQHHELVLVDTQVENYQELINGIVSQGDANRDIEVVLLDKQQDGIEQISNALATHKNLDAVHLISHGNDGQLNIGSSLLNAETLSQHFSQISAWGDAFNKDGDFLIYGCNVAETDLGQQFINNLSALTQTDVAASKDITGNSALGGNWSLEYDLGPIDSQVAVSAFGQQSWFGTLSTYTVTNTNDSGAGSLRQAIIDANNNAGIDTINFNIGAALVGGAHTIALTSALPSITGSVIIDGTTEPDYTVGKPVIQIDGTNAGSVGGLVIASGAGGSTIRGLAINNFSDSTFGTALWLQSGADSNLVEGNIIGLKADGTTTAASQNLNGIRVDSSNNTIGGTTAAARNVLSGNLNYGVILYGNNNVVIGNYIGTDATGTLDKGNFYDGVAVVGSNNRVGGTTAAERNIISGNDRSGIEVSTTGISATLIQGNYIGTDVTGEVTLGNGWGNGIWIGVSATGVMVGGTASGAGNIIANTGSAGLVTDTSSVNFTALGNRIYNNTGLGIDLKNDGVTANDSGDGDTGANGLQNFPVLSTATSNGNGTTITGSLNSNANTSYRIEFYANRASTADGTGYGEAERYLGYTTVTTDGSGNTSFSALLTDEWVNNGDKITATATVDLGGGNYGATSEFAANITATSSGVIVVDTASDVADSTPTSISDLAASRGADGRISLREAILAANTTTNGGTPDKIVFAIPGTDTHTIALASMLPTISEAVIIDASTDDSFAANSNRPAIVLDVNGNANGLTLSATADGSTIRGLVVRNFSNYGISIATGSSGNTIAGNYIGAIDASGNYSAAPNAGTDLLFVTGDNNLIGGSTAADRNVLANQSPVYGVYFGGAGAFDNRVFGNYIGTDATGNVATYSAAGTNNVYLNSAGSNNQIGGSGAGEGNVIFSTVYATGQSTGNKIEGNYFNVRADGTDAISSSFGNQAVRILSGSSVSVLDNWLAYGGGISVESTAAGAVIQGNRIGTDLAGTANWGTALSAITLGNTAGGSLVGGTDPGQGNVIAYSNRNNLGYNGIVVTTGTGNALLGNEIYGTQSGSNMLGIDLSNNGVTANDSGDGDIGANNLQNFPVLTTASTNASNQITLNGTLNSTANSYYRIEFFANTSQHSTGYGEGQRYLGFVNVATDGSGNATISTTLSATVAVGEYISATATKSNSNYDTFTDTSEFARNVAAVSSSQASITVDTANDTSDGDTTSLSTLLANKGADGFISLREAITAANNTANGSGGADIINFSIGSGSQAISLASALPTLTDAVTIDGWSQPGWSTRPLIILDANQLAAIGLEIGANADGSTIRGLVMRDFSSHAIQIDAGSSNNTIVGNYLGSLGSGGTDAGVGEQNLGSGINVLGDHNTIGGTTATERNVISGNANSGVQLSGASANYNVVQGNYIGVDRTGATALANSQHGIYVTGGAQNNTLGGTATGSGNVISGNGFDGIRMDSGSNTVQGNTIGLNAAFTVALANPYGIVNYDSSNTIGGTATGAGNVISGNTAYGIWITGATSAGTVVQGNIIGTNVNGDAGLGNGNGILIDTAATNTLVGGTTALASNTIAYNLGKGIELLASAGTGNTLLGNKVYSNNGLGIDLGITGVTANDAGDTDTGGNSSQNFPVLTTARTNNSNQLIVTGSINSTANSYYRIEFFANTSQNSTGYGEGQRYLGFINVATDGSGNATISTTLSATVAVGEYISATATQSDASFSTFTDTSEFARNIAAVSSSQASITVDTATDTSDGDTTSLSTLIANKGADGFISLREAITAANNTANGSSPDKIQFAISGAGIHTITLSSLLPNITQAVYIDGRSQGGLGYTGSPLIVLNGNNSIQDGLRLYAGSDGSTINGLTIQNFTEDGIDIVSSNNNTIIGNYIGTNAAGTASAGNQHGINIWDANNNIIGGSTATERNLISGNSNIGVNIGGMSTGNLIQGNYIGTNASGNLAVGNVNLGIFIGSAGNSIGGSLAGQGNVISASYYGIYLGSTGSNTTIAGNLIGLDATGTTALGNAQSGVYISSANNTIGGTTAGARNIISGSTQGIEITGGSASGNSILGNSIYNNASQGIDLGGNGTVQSNDLGDSDTGANNLQNFPVLASAGTTGSQIHITGSINTDANTSIRIEFFANTSQDASGYGEGQTYLGYSIVKTDGSGNATIDATLGASVANGAYITATATNLSTNSTSEFAQNIVATTNTAPTFSVGNGKTNYAVSGIGSVATMVELGDGRIMAGGDNTVYRMLANGQLDTSFNGTGVVTGNALYSTSMVVKSIVVQTDGKIIVVGFLGADLAIVRLNVDGSRDTSFDTDGYVQYSVASGNDSANAVVLQSDGKIVIAGQSASGSNVQPFVMRLNQNGSLDTNFNGSGYQILATGGTNDRFTALALQSDGRIIAVGSALNGANQDAVIVRFNTDGSLDTSFNSTGILLQAIGSGNDEAIGVAVLSNGRIVVGANGNYYTAIRLLADGSLDSSFGTGGVATAASYSNGTPVAMAVETNGAITLFGSGYYSVDWNFIGLRFTANGALDTGWGASGLSTIGFLFQDYAFAVTARAGGGVLVGGYTYTGPFAPAVAALTGSGVLDTHYGQVNTLNGTPTYIENGTAVVLDSDVQIVDEELSTSNNFSGATLSLTRNGGANIEDIFSATGSLSTLTQGGNLVVGGVIIGTVTSNSGGNLLLTFNASASNALVNSAMRQIAYSNSSDTPPASVQIDWLFDDGNSGAQGTGGALSASGSTTVSITVFDDAPASAGGSVTGTEDVAKVFTWSAFNVSDVDTAIGADTAIQVSTLPARGTLQYFNGSTWLAVSVNQVLTKATIDSGHLRFVPTANEWGEDASASPGVGHGLQTYAQFNFVPVQTTAIAIANPGAEAQVMGEDGHTAAPTDWTASSAGAWNPSTLRFSIDNDNAFYIDGHGPGSLTQTLAAAFSSSNHYNLSFELGWRADLPKPDFRVELWAGATRLDFVDQTTITLVQGQFVSGSLAIDGSSFGALDGQALQIRLISTANQLNVDNLVLTSSITSSIGTASTMNVDITAVNDVPSLTAPATLTINEDTLSSLGISIADADAGTGPVRLSLTTYNGATLAFANVSGAVMTASTGNGVVFYWDIDGTLAQIQQELPLLQFQTAANFTGNTSVALTFSDLGSTGSGGVQQTTANIAITVTAVNDAPVLTAANLTLNEGQTATLSPANIGITDPDSSSFTYTVSGLTGGYFQLSNNAGVAITSFSSADLSGGLVQFVHDGNEAAPTFSVTANDGSASSNTLAATVVFTHVNDAPVLATANLTLNEGQTVTLSPANFSITDPDTSSFTYNVSGVTGGYFQLSSNAGVAVISFSSADLSGGLVQFVHDGNEAAPTFSATVNDGSASSATLAASISYTSVNDAPSFASGGVVKTAVGAFSANGFSVTIQADGKILVAGSSNNGSNNDFALSRYNADGSLDTNFGIGGQITTSISVGNDSAYSITLQADGKILLAGSALGPSNEPDFALARYNADGSLDTSFGSGGIVTAQGQRPFADEAFSVTVQTDGKILVGGYSEYWDEDFALMRFNTDGSLDASFGGSGKVYVDFYNHVGLGLNEDRANAVTLQTDGKIIVAGYANAPDSVDWSYTSYFAAVRYNPDGTLDNSFGTAGVVFTPIGVDANAADANDPNYAWSQTAVATSVVLQPDGSIVLGGYAHNGSSSYDLALVRYLSNGSLDPSFGSGGIVLSDATGLADFGKGMLLQPDGKLVIAGHSAANGGEFLVARFNSSGSLDTSFNNNGIVTIDLGSGNDQANSIALQANGQLVLVGSSVQGGINQFALVRLNNNGSLDPAFAPLATLDANPTFIENGTAVILDSNVQVTDAELSTANNFNGATLTLSRNGGVNGDDVFSNTGNLGTLTEGTNLTVGGIIIGTVTTNSGGTLLLTFNSNATNALVNSAMQQIAYANNSDTPPASVQIDWLFNDGNSSAQGTGGALSAAGSVTVNITAINDAPIINSVGLTLNEGQTVTLSPTNISITDPDNSSFTYTVSAVTGGYFQLSSNAGVAITSFSSAELSGGLVQFVHDGNEAAPTFSVTANDGSANSNTLAATVAFTNVNDAPILVGANLTLNEGQTVILSPANFSITDPDTSSFTYNVSSVTGGYFQLSNNAGAAITSFSSTDLAGNLVQFVHDGNEAAPAFSVTVNDGSANSNTLAATVAFTNINDAPVLAGANFTLNEGQTVTLNPADFSITDPDSSSFTYTVSGLTGGYFQLSNNAGVAITSFSSADLSGGLVQFVHDGNEAAPTFSAAVNDGSANSNTLAATVVFTNVNDTPSLTAPATLTINEDTLSSLGISIADADAGTGPVRLSLTTHNGATLVFANVSGAVMTASTGNGVVFYWDIDGTLAQIQQELTLLQFQSAANFTGNTSVALTFSDLGNTGSGGVQQTTANIAITVTAVNDAPVLTAANLTLNEGQTVTLSPANFSITDPDSSSFTYNVSGVTGGYFQLSSNAGTIITSFSNADLSNGLVQFVHDGNGAAPAFSVTANDGSASSNTLAATVVFTNVNDAPILAGANLTLNEGQTVNLSPANFSITDPDSSSFTYTVSGVTSGYFQLSNNAGTAITSFSSADLAGGLVQFVHDGNESAPAFSITANDGSASSNTLAATVVFTNLNDTPTANADNINGDEDNLITGNVLINDSDPEQNTLTAVLVSNPSHGSLVLNPDGSFSYTPSPDWNGIDTFTYQANDGDLNSGIANVSINVAAVNDDPVALADEIALPQGNSLKNLDVLAKATDVDGDSLTVTKATALHGSVSVNADGSLNYSPHNNFSGTDIIDYTVSDLKGGTTTGELSINVIQANSPLIFSGPTPSVNPTITPNPAPTEVTSGTNTSPTTPVAKGDEKGNQEPVPKTKEVGTKNTQTKPEAQPGGSTNTLLGTRNQPVLETNPSTLFLPPITDNQAIIIDRPLAEFRTAQPQPNLNQWHSKAFIKTNMSYGIEALDNTGHDAKQSTALKNNIELMKKQMDADKHRLDRENIEIEFVTGASISITAGVVTWILRSGALLSSLLSSVSLFSQFDPLAVVFSTSKKTDQPTDNEDDPNDQEHKVESMFDKTV